MNKNNDKILMGKLESKYKPSLKKNEIFSEVVHSECNTKSRNLIRTNSKYDRVRCDNCGVNFLRKNSN